MKDRNARVFDNIYEMWMRLQALLEKGEVSGDGFSRENFSLAVPRPGETGNTNSNAPLAVTQYFLTVCVKPSPEVLALLPDNLFVAC